MPVTAIFDQPDLSDLGVPAFAVSLSVQGTTLTVHLRGGLDVRSAAVLSEHLAHGRDEQPRALVFDLTRLSYLDCAGARVIAGAARLLPPGQRPVLRGPGPVVRRLLQLTGLDRQLVIEPAGPEPGPGRDQGW